MVTARDCRGGRVSAGARSAIRCSPDGARNGEPDAEPDGARNGEPDGARDGEVTRCSPDGARNGEPDGARDGEVTRCSPDGARNGEPDGAVTRCSPDGARNGEPDGTRCAPDGPRSAPEIIGSGSKRAGGGQVVPAVAGGADVGPCRAGEIGPAEKPYDARLVPLGVAGPYSGGSDEREGAGEGADGGADEVAGGGASENTGGSSVPSVNHEPPVVASAGGRATGRR